MGNGLEIKERCPNCDEVRMLDFCVKWCKFADKNAAVPIARQEVKPVKVKRTSGKQKPVWGYCLNTKTYKKFDSVGQASAEIDVHISSISNNLKGRVPSSKGWVFSRTPFDETTEFPNIPKEKQSRNGTRVKHLETGIEYKSILEASEKTGHKERKIRKHIHGEIKSKVLWEIVER